MWDFDRDASPPVGRHWLILHGPWNDDEDRPEWMEIEHETCLLQTHVYEEEIYEDPTPEELADGGLWRELRPTGKTRVVFESQYANCPVDDELNNTGLEAFGNTYRYIPWTDVNGDRRYITESDLWPKGLPRIPGRYEITHWVHYYLGEYGGIGDYDAGLRLVCSWQNLDGGRYDADDEIDSGPGYHFYNEYGYGYFLTGRRRLSPTKP